MPIVFDLVGQQWQRKIIVLIVSFLGACLLMTSGSMSPEDNLWHEAIERGGVFFILTGIVGRTWCSMYIGGNKLRRLVTEGPYSLTRNPLYLFSAIASFGLGAQLGSIVFALLCAAATIAIFLIVIRHEERALAGLFPAEYTTYKAQVPANAVVLRLAGCGRDTRPAGIGVPDIWGRDVLPARDTGTQRLGKPAGRMADRACFPSLLTERVSRHATSATPTTTSATISSTSAIQNSLSARLMSAAITSRRPSPMNA
jgi:protein-S-isoprenylcysteine O-methyltransferase Ste14